MCYLYLKLRVFMERKLQPKSVPKGVVSFIYSIDKKNTIIAIINQQSQIILKINRK